MRLWVNTLHMVDALYNLKRERWLYSPYSVLGNGAPHHIRDPPHATEVCLSSEDNSDESSKWIKCADDFQCRAKRFISRIRGNGFWRRQRLRRERRGQVQVNKRRANPIHLDVEAHDEGDRTSLYHQCYQEIREECKRGDNLLERAEFARVAHAIFFFFKRVYQTSIKSATYERKAEKAKDAIEWRHYFC